MIVWVSIVWKQEEQFTASVSCTSSHDSSNYHHPGGFVPPDGGSLECRQIIRDRWQNTRVPSLIISTPFIQFSLQSRPNHNSPEAPCSSPAEQSLPTLPPARPQSRRAAAAARGQSSSAPQCRAPREQPDGTENTCAEKSALKWSWRSSSYRNVFMGKWNVWRGKLTKWIWWYYYKAKKTKAEQKKRGLTLRCGEVSRCSSSFSSVLIGPLWSSSATCQSQSTHERCPSTRVCSVCRPVMQAAFDCRIHTNGYTTDMHTGEGKWWAATVSGFCTDNW